MVSCCADKLVIHSADSSNELSDLHITQSLASEVRCTLQWSQSGHRHVFVSYSQEDIKRATKENLKWKKFPTYRNQYLAYKSYSSFKPTWILLKILCVSSNDTLTKMKNLDASTKTGSQLGIKQTLVILK